MRLTGFYLTDAQIKERVDHFRYVRDKEKNPIGIVVLDKQGRIGWSLYNEVAERKEAEKKGLIPETASTDRGLSIALHRAVGFDPIIDLNYRISAVRKYSCDADTPRLRAVLSIVQDINRRLLDVEEICK